MRLGHPVVPVLAALCSAACAHSSATRTTPEDMAAQLERRFAIREPDWKGATPANGSPSYDEALAVVRALLERHRDGVPDRLATAPPCVLRVVRADDFAARAPNPSIGLLYQSTWVDLRQVTGIAAQAFGRDPKNDVPTIVATCALLRGAPGFARRTEVLTLPRQTDPVHRADLDDEPGPRICVANDVEPEELARPLRQLATLCGGQPAPVSLEDVPDSPNIRKSLETLQQVFISQDIERLERELAQGTADADAWAELGSAYHQSDRLDDAAGAYAKALALRPRDPAVLNDRGVVYRAMGRSEEALESFRLAIEADPTQLESLFNIGLVNAYDLRQPEEAATAWAKLFALDPRSKLALRARWEIGKLGSLYAHGEGVQQDWAKAKALYERSCELGETLACQSLAGMYANGHGVPRDDAKVEELRKKACELGDEQACGAAR